MDRIEKRVSIDTILDVVDEVHTITSLVGLEALLREKKVVCYGTPFYAGWGLTEDKQKIIRGRKLTLLELIAGVYILYSKYINPRTLEPCEIEDVLEELKAQKELYHSSFKHRLKVNTQNFINRKRFAVERNIDEVSDFFKKANRRVKKFFRY